MPTRKELNDLAKENGLRGYSTMTKAELMAELDHKLNQAEAKEAAAAQETAAAPTKRPKRKSAYNAFISTLVKEGKYKSIPEAAKNYDKEAYAKFKETWAADN